MTDQVIRLQIFINGDGKSLSRPFSTTRRGLSYEGLMDRITARFGPRFGAIRRMYTIDGKRVNGIDEIVNDMAYVVSNNLPFKKLDYGAIKLMTQSPGAIGAKSKTGISKREPTVVRGRAQREASTLQSVSIQCIRNGDVHSAPARVVLNTTFTWDQVLNAVNRRVNLNNGAVRRLFAMDGSEATSVDQLAGQGIYVAAGREAMKKVSYAAWKEMQSRSVAPPQKSPKKSPQKQAAAAPPKQQRGSIKASRKYDELEKKIKSTLKNKAELRKLWTDIDYNGNGIVSLAEIDKLVSSKFPLLNQKPALMRAYRQTTLNDGDGDSWVEKNEFVHLLRNLFYFNKLFDAFEDVDKDDDRRVDWDEFKAAAIVLGLRISPTEMKSEFAAMDANGQGQVLFDEFARWAAERACPVDGEVVKTFTTAEQLHTDDRRAGRGKAKAAAAGASGPEDDHPDLEETDVYADVEEEFQSVLTDMEKLRELWSGIDYNGNGKVSLAEIDKFVCEKYPVLNNKPALMRAYKRTTMKDGDGDAWVERNEFRALLRNMMYFNKLFDAFDDVDTDDDRRLSLEEFVAGLKKIGMNFKTKAAAKKEFDSIDSNSGGVVLFDEFCMWYANKMTPGFGDSDLSSY